MISVTRCHEVLTGWTYINDRASAGGSGMLSVFQDVFLAEAPVTPAEIADFVDAVEIEY